MTTKNVTDPSAKGSIVASASISTTVSPLTQSYSDVLANNVELEILCLAVTMHAELECGVHLEAGSWRLLAQQRRSATRITVINAHIIS